MYAISAFEIKKRKTCNGISSCAYYSFLRFTVDPPAITHSDTEIKRAREREKHVKLNKSLLFLNLILSSALFVMF